MNALLHATALPRYPSGQRGWIQAPLRNASQVRILSSAPINQLPNLSIISLITGSIVAPCGKSDVILATCFRTGKEPPTAIE
jgi:hypothetical protein